MTFRLRLLIVAGAIAVGTSGAVADNPHTLKLVADRDATLYEDALGQNAAGSGEWVFAGATATLQKRRALLHFDVAAFVPPGSVILSAKLTLSMSRSISANESIQLHAASASWGEGSSVPMGGGGGGGAGGIAVAGDATWLHRFYPGSSWVTAGGDFAPAASAVQSVGGLGFYTWGSTSQMVADVQQWLTAPSANNGWILIGAESAAHSAKRFDSRENPVPQVRPQLTLTFNSPVDVPAPPNLDRLVLHAGVPNPFNPRTALRYSLPESGHVRLDVYDAHGAWRTSLVDREQLAGEHVAIWNGRDAHGRGLASGIYVVKLVSQGATRSRSVVLVK